MAEQWQSRYLKAPSYLIRAADLLADRFWGVVDHMPVTGKLPYRTRSTHQCIYCRKQWESTQKKPSHFLQFLKLTIFWRALKYWHGSLTEASSPFFPFFPVDVATKTERELWWEHCQGAKDDGSHGKGQRSWHQSQVSILPFTITAVRGTREHHPKWVHLHVETNSKDAAKKARNCQSSNFIGKALDLTTNKPIFPQQLTDRVPINLFYVSLTKTYCKTSFKFHIFVTSILYFQAWYSNWSGYW